MRFQFNATLAALCAAFGIVLTSSAATLTVCPGGSCGFTSIQSAINASSHGDVIEIAAGTYSITQTLNPGGKAITLRGAIDPNGRPITILDGLSGRSILKCVSGEGASMRLENLVIRNGWNNYGGGLFLASGSPTITNCVISKNSGVYESGGIYVGLNSSPTISSTVFCGNTAPIGPQISGSGRWIDGGNNCFASRCDDLDSDGRPDECGTVSDGVHLVPAEFSTIESAILAAGQGDLISVAPGTYTLTAPIDPSAKPLIIRGAVDKQGRPITILSGGDTTRVIRCVSGEGPGTRFENLVLRDGYAQSRGGAVQLEASSPSFLNCIITESNSTSRGGGISLFRSSPTLTNCVVSRNTATEDGGGFSAYLDCNPVLESCVIEDNRALQSGAGGGVHIDRGALTMRNCTITLNLSEDPGGGASVFNSEIDFADCVFSNNSGGLGAGGLHVVNCTDSTITGTSFIGNRAHLAGAQPDHASGGLSVQDSSIAISDCEITANLAGSGGGATFSGGGVVVSRCLFAKNTASGGSSAGGGVTLGTGATLVDCVVTDNVSSDRGGGIAIGGSPTLLNCDITANSAGRGGGLSLRNTTGGLMLGCRIDGNTANYYGGGFDVEDTTLMRIENTLIAGNHAVTGGGGAHVRSNTSFELVGCEISENTAGGVGGGIYIESNQAVATFSHCNIVGNSAASPYSRGGGVAITYSSPVFSHCTISQNHIAGPYAFGGGIALYAAGIPTLEFSDVCGNTAGASNQIYQYATAINDAGGNCISEDCAPCGLPDADRDGVPDNFDNCPATFNPTQSDCDDDGVGDACRIAEGSSDANGNGIPDSCECLGDATGNGTIDGLDLAVILGAWGGSGNGEFDADVNDDGIVDAQDLTFVLGSWGPCQN
jgi:hypothetical protein